MAKRRVMLDAWKAEKADTAGVEIEAGNGEVFVIPHPGLWSDEVLEAAMKGDHITAARGMLGDRYDAWIDAGGTATSLALIAQEELGASLGE